MDFGKLEAEYFCAEGWTGEIGLKLLEEIAVLAQQILHLTSAIECYRTSAPLPAPSSHALREITSVQDLRTS
jgi:hypothetical protein